MRKLSNIAMASITSEVTTLTQCIKIQSHNKLIALTGLDKDLEISGITYKANFNIHTSALESYSDTTSSNMEISADIVGHLISKEEIQAGDLNGANIQILLLDYATKNSNAIVAQHGFISRVHTTGEKVTCEFSGLKNPLKQNIGNLYSPTCRANFCDKACGLNPINYQFEVRILKHIDQYQLKLDKEFEENSIGILDFNKRLHLIASNHKNIMTSLTPIPEASNKEGVVQLKCDKTIATCSEKFNNATNFRGEPNYQKP